MSDRGISVIIPTWCEADQIVAAVTCARTVGDEVLVVDANSPDRTAELAQAAGARLIDSGRGRGTQLHAGASAARGEWLLFLHADTRIPAQARDVLHELTPRDEIIGGNFAVRFDPPSRWGELFRIIYHWRRRLLRMYYGDSAMFVRRRSYRALGGFRPLPVLEDYELARRMERLGQTRYVHDVVVSTSSRRFIDRPLHTLGVWAMIQGLYTFGVPPDKLARLYADIR